MVLRGKSEGLMMDGLRSGSRVDEMGGDGW
jgi:hypothetical protein